MKKVEGHGGLYRDSNGAIVNMDSESYSKYKTKKLIDRNKSSKIDSIEKELEETKEELREIKNLIMKILDK